MRGATTRYLLCTVLVFVACRSPFARDLPTEPPAQREPPVLVRVPGAVTQALLDADEFHLFAVVGFTNPRFKELRNAPHVAGNPILAETALEPRLGREVVRLLISPQTYAPEGEGWTCLPNPRYVLRARQGKSTVFVVLHGCLEVDLIPVDVPAAAAWSHALCFGGDCCGICRIFDEVLPHPDPLRT